MAGETYRLDGTEFGTLYVRAVEKSRRRWTVVVLGKPFAPEPPWLTDILPGEEIAVKLDGLRATKVKIEEPWT